MTPEKVGLGVPQAALVRLAVLRRLLVFLRRERCEFACVLEIGSYEGESAVFWSRAIGALFPLGGLVLCIDPWEPYFTEEEIARSQHLARMAVDLRSGGAYNRFLRNVASSEHDRAPIHHLRSTLSM